MKPALKAISILAMLGCGSVCFAQDASAIQTVPSASSASEPANDQTDNTKPSAPTVPIPPVGDPLFAPVALSGAPQTLDQRFMSYAVITFGPRGLVTPMLGAELSMLNPPSGYPKEWRQGMSAFGRNYASSLAARTSEQTARFLTAAVLHEDFRYRPSTSTNPLARTFHALAFTFVDKSDSGHNRIAFSNFAAAAAGGLTPNLYLPAGYNNLAHAETRMAVTLGGFAAQNLGREFSPELLKLTRKLHVPFPRIPVPEWWTPIRR